MHLQGLLESCRVAFTSEKGDYFERLVRCCQTNESKHQYSFEVYFCEITKER